jgi:mannose-6-phosphate isomerase-like protein (cupin superfamily)
MPIMMTRATEAPRFQLPGLEFTGLASPSRGSTDVCTWRLTLEPGLTSPEPHTLDRDEIFMVTRGAIRLAPDAEPVRAGDVAVVPAGSPIQVANVGEGEAEVVVAIASGFTAAAADGSSIGTPPWAV